MTFQLLSLFKRALKPTQLILIRVKETFMTPWHWKLWHSTLKCSNSYFRWPLSGVNVNLYPEHDPQSSHLYRPTKSQIFLFKITSKPYSNPTYSKCLLKNFGKYWNRMSIRAHYSHMIPNPLTPTYNILHHPNFSKASSLFNSFSHRILHFLHLWSVWIDNCACWGQLFGVIKFYGATQ